VVVATEGGYHLKGIADSLHAVVGALDAVHAEDQGPSSEEEAPRGEATIAAVKPNLAKYWPL
jgi:acetoin utilization deacetylase AcuC-like enzyme